MKGIEFDEIRKKIDGLFNCCHDELSYCYYNQKAFVWNGRNYGIIGKELFDKLHGLIFDLREVAFFNEAQKDPNKGIVSDEKVKERVDIARNNIVNLAKQDLILEIK